MIAARSATAAGEHRSMRLAARIVSTLVLTVGFLVASGSAAPADTGVDDQVGDYLGMAPPDGVPFEETQYAKANKDLIDAEAYLYSLYAQKLGVVEGQKSNLAAARQSINRLDSKIAVAQARLSRLTGRPASETAPEPRRIGAIQVASKSSGAAVSAAACCASASMSVAQVGQKYDNWCGPATGYMILKYKGKTSKNGVALSQAALSGSGYMGTGTGSTDWGSGDMPRGLNNWGSLGYTQAAHSTTASFKTRLTSKIEASRPLALGTAEYKNLTHYNGHPVTSNVYHWIAARGYSNYGDSVSYLDPATTVWAATNASGSMTTAKMRGFMAPYGSVA